MRLSLRARVLIGAVLWTVGLVLLSFVIIAHVFRHAPDLPFLGRQGTIHYIWGSHAFLIVVTSAIALTVGALQVRRGLAGITQLRTRLSDVHGGRAPRVQGDYVPEVQPLVDDLNALLEQREQLDVMRQKAELVSATPGDDWSKPELAVGEAEIEVALLRERQKRQPS